MRASRKNILLIEPPFHRLFKASYSLERYPLALGYLAGAIRGGTDWDVKTYNADFTPHGEMLKVAYLAGAGYENFRRQLTCPDGPVWGEIRRTLAETRPGVVGISTKTQTYGAAKRIARLAKEQNPETLVVLGGPHPSILGLRVLNDANIDLAVVGEGEETIVELLRALEAGRSLEGVKGIAYRKQNQAVCTPPRPLLDDLDALPFPYAGASTTLLEYETYPRTAFRFVFALRGCPYDCYFCGSRRIWTRRVRFRSPESVIAELQALQARGLRFVHFDDDTFGVQPAYIFALCAAIQRHCPDLRWSCEMHVHLLRDDLLAAMRRAGCYRIQVGVESGSDTILRAMRKGFTIQQASDACRRVVRHGIELHTFFMFGFPQETEQTLAQTLRAMRRIASHRVVYSIFTPYPGTEAYDLCLARGLIDEEQEVSLLYHQNPEHCFCLHIEPERFRRWVSQVERAVDRRNAFQRIRELFSLDTLRRARELGFVEAVRKGLRILQGR